MDFNKGPLIEIHLGKGFWFVEIRFWTLRFVGKSEIRNQDPAFPIESPLRSKAHANQYTKIDPRK